MHDPIALELLTRGAAAGAFAGLALLAAHGRSPARVAAVLFCLAAAAHAVTQMPGAAAVTGWAWPPLWALSAAGAGLFWVLAIELFEDSARLDPARYAPAGLLIALAVGAVSTEGRASSAFLLLHNLTSAVLIGHALQRIAAGWRGDLVEERRRLRGPILVIASIYALAVIAVQIGEIFLGSAAALSPVAAAALAMLALLGLAAFGRLDADLFGPPRPQAVEPPPSASARGEDAMLAGELDRLVRMDRIYREEGLTIAALALRLRTTEHRLRRLINQGLGHRNFSAFLNAHRLADAKAALSDPEQAAVSVSTIALDAGFGSLGPFNRAFKADTGLTPTEYRARALGAEAGSAAPNPAV
jgi:AraC-like DNA-binding protein